MARPRTFQTTSAAQMIINYDEKRTSLRISNVSGETCYIGVDPTVSISGLNQGEPIFSNGRFTAAFYEGIDPRLERWIIGSVGGQLIVGEDRV